MLDCKGAANVIDFNIMNHVDVLLRTPTVALTDFHHPPEHEHADPESEIAESDSINFVEAGSFDIAMRGDAWRLDPSQVFIAARGMGFSCRHDRAVPTDRCLCVTYTPDAVEDLMLADVPPLRPPAIPLSTRLTFLRQRLRTIDRDESIRLDLLAGALYQAAAADEGAPRRRTVGMHTDLMRRIDRAIDLIESDYDQPLTLRDLATTAGLSPFHFAREFKSLTGVPPHRYLTAVRLRHAAALLAGGASVSFTCYEVGFGSLSHFVTAFRRRYGVIPSDAKRGRRAPILRASLNAPVWGRARR